MTMRTDDFSVAFHVGAHKTATTHLQWSLQRASFRLANAGVQYYGPDHFRLPRRSLNRLFGLRHGTAITPRRAAADQLALMRKGAHRLVLSEENFIGVLNNPRRKAVRQHYPEAADRIAALAAALQAPHFALCIGIRHPAGYLNSGYGQQLLGGRIMSMEQYLRRHPLENVDWLSLVERLRDARGVSHVTVWRYEDYGPLFPRICGALVGEDAAPLVRPYKRPTHVGLSARAVAAVHAQFDGTNAQGLAQKYRTAFPTGDEYPGFDGFDKAAHAAVSAAYDAQCAAIAGLSGVTFLTPG